MFWFCHLNVSHYHTIVSSCFKETLYYESFLQILCTPSMLHLNCSTLFLMSVALQYYESNEALESRDSRLPLQFNKIFHLLGCYAA